MQITRQQFNEAVMSYAMATVTTTPAADDLRRVEWGFAGTHGIDVVDERTFTSAAAAMNAAEYYIRNHCPDLMAIGKNEAKEWMRYNGHTFE